MRRAPDTPISPVESNHLGPPRDRTRLLTLYEITRALAESATIEEVTPRILRAICENLDWDVAALWAAGPGAGITCAGTWQACHEASSAFLDATRQRTFASGVGLPGLVLASGTPAWVSDLAATDFPRAELADREGVHGGFAFPILLSGKVLGAMEFYTREVRPPDEELLRDMESVGSQIGQFIERTRAEQALLAEQSALSSQVQELERARAELTFLLDASTALTGSLDYREGMQRLARVAASTLCDVCIIDAAQPDGTLERVVCLAADPSAQNLADELALLYPPDRYGTTPAAQCIVSRKPFFSPDISSSSDEDLLRSMASSREHLGLIRRLGVHSYLAVPLMARGRTLGALTLVATNRSSRSYGESHLALAGELARQAALTLDNARLYEQERDLAQTLQQSLLPPTLPLVSGIDLAGRYVPASGQIGGDFYDVFPLGDNRWILAIGDVCGKGPEAASLTSMVRYTLRGAAVQAKDSPAEVLRLVNESLVGQVPGSRFCTVACALVTPVPEGAWFVVSSAGHPLPLRRTAGGEVDAVGQTGTLLGVVRQVQLEDDHRLLAPGDSMAFFTDGALAEASASAPTAERRLAAVLRDCSSDAGAVATALARAASEGNARWGHRDDVAVLVARVGERVHGNEGVRS